MSLREDELKWNMQEMKGNIEAALEHEEEVSTHYKDKKEYKKYNITSNAGKALKKARNLIVQPLANIDE